jgi:hypothetical protein
MPSLDELEADTARLQALYRNITVTFDYHPARVGMNLQRAIAAVTRPPHDMGPIADELAKILAAWDLTRAGEPIPITPDGIGSLPMGIASAIGQVVMEDFHDPKSPSSLTASSASSASSKLSSPISRPDDSAPAPTGPSLSSEPNGPASIRPISLDSPLPVTATSGIAGSD